MMELNSNKQYRRNKGPKIQVKRNDVIDFETITTT